MSWKLGIATPVLACMLGCATAQPSPGPAPAASASSAGASLESIAGDYSLIRIDGHALPYPQPGTGQTTRSASWPVLSGSLSLRTNGTFHVETTYNSDVSGAQNNSYQFTGTCYNNEGQFNMVWDGGGETALAARGDTLVLNNEGRAFSYVRR